MEHSKISWTDATFNPWIGCAEIGPGCKHCYAAAYAKRVGRDFAVRTRTSADYSWRHPARWNKEPFYQCGCGHRGTMAELTTNAVHRCGLVFKPARRRVFCASLADVFDNQADPAWRADLFALIEKTPNLDWLLLTKRIGNVPRMLPIKWLGGLPSNIWLGATIVNQEEADRDIPKLLAIPARVRFLSMEPLLGPVDIVPYIGGRLYACSCGFKRTENEMEFLGGDRYRCRDCGERCALHRSLEWVIAGGESGHKARPMHLDWARSLRDQCAAAGVPFHFKQWGEWIPVDGEHSGRLSDATIRSHRGGHDWIDGSYSIRVGKAVAGRLLDGREYNSFPAAELAPGE